MPNKRGCTPNKRKRFSEVNSVNVLMGLGMIRIPEDSSQETRLARSARSRLLPDYDGSDPSAIGRDHAEGRAADPSSRYSGRMNE
jgi:hypothetical protein